MPLLRLATRNTILGVIAVDSAKPTIVGAIRKVQETGLLDALCGFRSREQVILEIVCHEINLHVSFSLKSVFEAQDVLEDLYVQLAMLGSEERLIDCECGPQGCAGKPREVACGEDEHANGETEEEEDEEDANGEDEDELSDEEEDEEDGAENEQKPLTA